jgi:hypothetical protein
MVYSHVREVSDDVVECSALDGGRITLGPPRS